MTLRRDRTHTCGLSNIDFRSKNDIDSLLLFQPWKTNTHFGTMGQSNYFRAYSAQKKVFGVTDKINTQKDLASDCPDPRYFTSAQFYKNNKIDLNQRSIFTNDRVAQLDETFKGKDRFTGDSMMIVDLTKQKNRLYSGVSTVQLVEVNPTIKVAGLENLKDWLKEKKNIFFAPDEVLASRSLETPKGILLAGVPGCGKSLSAKMISLEWELPLFRFDLGNVYDKWVYVSINFTCT